MSESEIDTSTGTLYMVATPIGNLGDLSRRAEDILKSVQIIAAEDTRRSSRLLAHIAHRAPELISYHEHNRVERTQRLLTRLLEGDDVALVSDAGTPLINDPGADLVSAAFDAGVGVVPVPGPSAVTAALSVCPFPSFPFRFVGFLPPKSRQRREVLRTYLADTDALIFFEAPHRIAETIKDLAELTARKVMLGRELTKRFETLTVVDADKLNSDSVEPRGEFVIVVGCDLDAKADVAGYEDRKVLGVLLEHLSPAHAAKCGALICDRERADMYEMALQINAERKK